MVLLCLLSSSAKESSRLVALSSWSMRLSGFTLVTSTRPVALAQPSSATPPPPPAAADFLLRRSSAALPRSSEPASTPLSTGDACDRDVAVPLDVRLETTNGQRSARRTSERQPLAGAKQPPSKRAKV